MKIIFPLFVLLSALIARQNDFYCKLKGKVYIEENARLADFRVYEEDSEAFADLLVFEEDNALYADRAGIWFFTENKGLADFSVSFVESDSKADFSVYFIESETFAGCQ